MEQKMRQHKLIKFFLAGTLLTSFFFIDLGGEGKASILADQSQKKELGKMYARPSLLVSSEPITSVQVSQFTIGAPMKSAQRLVEVAKDPKEGQSVTHKKKLGLTLFFLGMVADNN